MIAPGIGYAGTRDLLQVCLFPCVFCNKTLRGFTRRESGPRPSHFVLIHEDRQLRNQLEEMFLLSLTLSA